MAATFSRRVKVYRLEGEAWVDLGTGVWQVDHNDGDDCIVVRSEAAAAPVASVASANADERPAKRARGSSPDSAKEANEGGSLIWRSRIRQVLYLSEGPDGQGGNYQRQQETLIVWTEADGTDLALSFANVQGCSQVWDYIQSMRHNLFEQLSGSGSDEGSGSSDPLSGEDDESQQAEYLSRRRNSIAVANADDEPFPAGRGLGVSSAAFAGAGGSGLGGHHHHHQQPLPSPSLSNLNQVEANLRWSSRSAVGREKLSTWIFHTDYIRLLCAVFADAEDLEQLDVLHSLCVIMQNILLLNDNMIVEYILKNDIFSHVVGMLEYDPEYPTLKANYREHLNDPARFKEVVPIRDHATLVKVHQTYRLQYLKDVILARIIDDATFSLLNSFIFFHQVDIVNHLQMDERYLTELFAIFEEGEDAPPPPPEDEVLIGPVPPPAASSSKQPDADRAGNQHAAILLLQQFCSLAKNLQLAQRNQFYRLMGQRGLLKVLERALAQTAPTHQPPHEDARPAEAQRHAEEMRIATIDILMMVIDHNPAGVRAYCLSKAGEPKEREDGPAAPASKSLVLFLIELLLGEADLGIQAQMAEAIKVLVSTAGEPVAAGPVEAARAKNEDPEAEKFLQYFYEACIADLFKPVTDLADPASSPGGIQLDVGKQALCAHLCDLLCYFVAAHSFRSKYFVLSSTICIHAARLFQTPQKHLSLAALRFFKACLVRRDDFYNRHLMKHDLFRPILDLLKQEIAHSKNNMVISACLDFFEFLRHNNMKAVLNHLMDKYAETMDSLAEQDATMRLVKAKWEQNNEPPPPITEDNANAARQAPQSRETKTLEAEEESYFNDSSDDDTEPATSSDGGKAPSRKRQKTQGDADEDGPGPKRRRIDAATARQATSASSSATVVSPPPSRSPSGMVRSPALVFQEMAVQGARGATRRHSNTASRSPKPALVDYGEEEDELVPSTSNKALERTATIFPDDNGGDKPLPATPAPNLLLSPSAGDPVQTTLGSPFQAVTAPLSPTLEAQKPTLSLKSLGEKRRREEEEEDVLLSRAAKGGKAKNGPAGPKPPSSNGLGSKLRINLKTALLGDKK